MLFRMIDDAKLAQMAYLIGCQKTGQAILIDPERDVDRYLDAALREHLRITAVTETHIHADFLSGAREMAERTGATLYLSGEGGEDWSYRWLDAKAGGGTYDHELVRHGDVIRVGEIELRVLHTPGHTPEHICFLVTDRGGGASEPMGLVSGDFLFVGDLGRPDLLETAAGQVGAREPSARNLHASLAVLEELPDYLQIWPAHGSGSACGKALGAVPQTTLGYERRFNPALQAGAEGTEPFVEFILSGQPAPPMYFATMKRLNRDGVPLLGELVAPREMTSSDLLKLDAQETVVVDCRLWREFKAGHLAGAISTPLNQMLPGIVGSYVEPEQPIVLIVDRARVKEVDADLIRIGLDKIAGFATPETLESAFEQGAQRVVTPELSVSELHSRLEAGGVDVLDVRNSQEFDAGHIPGAMHVPHTRLAEHLDELPRRRPLAVHCQGGGRSARACSFLERRGVEVLNVVGGFGAWASGGLEVSTEGAPEAQAAT